MKPPEPKFRSERLEAQRKQDDILTGRRPVDRYYPYVWPDYELPYVHIGTDRQLFVDNFILDHLENVVREFPAPERPQRPLIEIGDLPWEQFANPIPSGAIHDPDDGKFKIWYCQSLTGDPFNTGQVLCYAESTDCVRWTKRSKPAARP